LLGSLSLHSAAPPPALRSFPTRRSSDLVGAVVIMRFGENAKKVIESVKAKLDEMKSTLPPGLEIVPTYDRSELIDRSIENLKGRSEEHTSELQSRSDLVCRLLLAKKTPR